MYTLKRMLRHLGIPRWWLRRVLPPASLLRIEMEVADSETRHGAEIRVALEANLGLAPLMQGQTARQRAEAVFSSLRVWDTELNNGVLIYLLLADREFEIVADRGLAKAIDQSEWERLCREMEAHFQQGRHEDGLIHGVHVIGKKLEALFPRLAGDVNELPDRPVIL